MSKHTPGPWTFKPAGRFVDINGVPTTRPECFVIDKIHTHVRTAGNVDRATANVRLIAAAPELLDAAQILMDYADSADESQYGALGSKFVRDTLRAALVKATGENKW
jgi:hypothetical protein